MGVALSESSGLLKIVSAAMSSVEKSAAAPAPALGRDRSDHRRSVSNPETKTADLQQAAGLHRSKYWLATGKRQLQAGQLRWNCLARLLQ